LRTGRFIGEAVALLEVERAHVRPVRREVARGVDREHAGHALRFVRIDALHHAMCMLAAHDEAYASGARSRRSV